MGRGVPRAPRVFSESGGCGTEPGRCLRLMGGLLFLSELLPKQNKLFCCAAVSRVKCVDAHIVVKIRLAINELFKAVLSFLAPKLIQAAPL